MRGTLVAIAAVGLLIGGAVQAQDALKAAGCLGCHDMDKKKVGPAYKDVAAKYKGNKDAEAMLVAKIKDGKGHAKINKPEADIKKAVEEALAAK
jgi:cytochrome c